MKKQNPIKKLATKIKGEQNTGAIKKHSVNKLLSKPSPNTNIMYAVVNKNEKNIPFLIMAPTRGKAIYMWEEFMQQGVNQKIIFKNLQTWKVKKFAVQPIN